MPRSSRLGETVEQGRRSPEPARVDLARARRAVRRITDRPNVLERLKSAAFVVAAGLHLNTGGESIPYLAEWGEDGALEAVTEAAQLIDEIARRIEDAITVHPSEPRNASKLAEAP